MHEILDSIRCADKKITISKQIIDTIASLLFGIALGTFSKFLDNTPVNELPFIFEYLYFLQEWSQAITCIQTI